MTLESDLKLIETRYNNFRSQLDNYALTGSKEDRILLEWELKHIRRFFGEKYYKEFNHIYQQVKLVHKYSSRNL